ncbi:MAG TPA: DUF4062 domain-containing protein [Tepidisphaeraceae bacterium]|jgi:tetratricopeptide (TPR) repeat protein|nr:DUF4062 domain-containing protein [Tepidisphaeraceae bacterium]
MTVDRQIRVFISSTFRDMQAERDYLVKFIFPQMRKLCESRGVIWGEVDLRWGVTDEQAAEGKVLPICLEEIKRCRPYFIGLLGERYGWIPDSIPADLLEREEWLKEHLHGKTSVTELEILHGVLRNPQMAGHAYFYFRDPKYVESVAEEERKNFVAENENNAEKLRTLKAIIRQSGFPVRENYYDPRALGELVLDDLRKVIDDLFPEGSQPDPLDREAMDHESYAQSRERVYIGRQEYFDRLDAYAAANDAQPLVILGESGSGKSALLANWVARYRKAHPDRLVLQHYIGATPYSADWAAMLRRLMGEFKRRLGIEQDIPDQLDALRSAFPNWLYMAAAKGRVVLVLDALNQLEDHDGAPDLVWMPPVLPGNVRLMVSTLPGRPLDEIQKREWPTFKVELLSIDQRRRLISEYLAQHTKSLNPARVERIATSPQSSNPLYLRVLLDELRLVRSHEELEGRIGSYLKAESAYELYEKIIVRWEHDYEGESDLVGDTLSMLWAARRGLTETELLQALGKDGEIVPRAVWSPLLLAMSESLVSRAGLLTFAHDFLRGAVEIAYLPNEQNRRRSHLRLANYFERQAFSARRTDELPWQLSRAAAWHRLFKLLANPKFFEQAWEQNKFNVKVCWAQIEMSSPLRILDAYREFIEHPRSVHKDLLWCLGDLLAETGHFEQALTIRARLSDYLKSEGDSIGLASCLNNLAVSIIQRGGWDDATKLLKEAEGLCLAHDDLSSLAMNLGNQASICKMRGQLNQAMHLHKREEALCRKANDVGGLARSLGNQATILAMFGEFESALALHEAEERIFRQLGNLDGLQCCLGNQAYVFMQITGGIVAADELCRQKEDICRQLGNLDGLARSLSNRGLILFARGDFQQSMALQKEAEEICRQIGNDDLLASILGYEGFILMERGDLEGALCLHKKAEDIFRRLENIERIAFCLANQSLALKHLNRKDEAIELAEESLQLAQTHGYSVVVKQVEPILNDLRKRA